MYIYKVHDCNIIYRGAEEIAHVLRGCASFVRLVSFMDILFKLDSYSSAKESAAVKG